MQPRQGVTHRDVRDTVPVPAAPRRISSPVASTVPCATTEATALKQDTIRPSPIENMPCLVPPSDDKALVRSKFAGAYSVILFGLASTLNVPTASWMLYITYHHIPTHSILAMQHLAL